MVLLQKYSDSPEFNSFSQLSSVYFYSCLEFKNNSFEENYTIRIEILRLYILVMKRLTADY